MKIRIVLATATAMGVLMTAAALAGDNVTALVQLGGGIGANTATVDQSAGSLNVAKVTQEGNTNAATINQGGTGNWAGTHLKYSGYDQTGDGASGYNYMLQKGSNNTLTISQTNKGNIVAVDGSLNQFGDRNVALITQVGGASSGGRVNAVTQTATVGAAALTNKLTISQQGAAPGAYAASPPNLAPGHSNYNYADALVSTVQQTHTGGAPNYLDITQSGGTYQAGNTVTLAVQNGSDNDGDVTQTGRLNLLTQFTQLGNGNDAILSQTGYNNKTALISQDSDSPLGNYASVVLSGTDNGRNGLTGAAAAAGALSASVQQIGHSNVVDYSAFGDDNEYGFYQNGIGNLADDVSITGNRNQLGVHQTGTDNKLVLAAINGDDNIIGLKQSGTSNQANVTIGGSGDRNGGYGAFTGTPASSAGLTAGLLTQTGTSNSFAITVTGSDNVFASLQDNSLYAGPDPKKNKIVGTVTGDSNQIAVKQVGNNNTASFTQTGSSNNALISQ